MATGASPRKILKRIPSITIFSGLLTAVLAMVLGVPYAASAAIINQGGGSVDITNGDFSAGNTGFASDYSFVTGGQTTPGQYGVITDAATAFTNGYASYGDHTTGTGQMMFVDGSAAGGATVWSETINPDPGTVYSFSGWAANAYSQNAPILRFLADGTQIGSDFTLSLTAGLWQNFTASLNTDSFFFGPVTLSIIDVNQTPMAAGNDFTLDDISVSAVPLPAAGWLFGSGLMGLVGVARRKMVA